MEIVFKQICSDFVIVSISYLLISVIERAKTFRPDFISMIIWTGTPGSYYFTDLGEPLVHSIQNTEGKDQTKEEMGTGTGRSEKQGWTPVPVRENSGS